MNANGRSIDVWKAAEYLRNADIVVGVPSYNNARTVGHVVRAAYAGLAKFFPQLTSVVVSVDRGSTDRTRDEVLVARAGDQHLLMLSTPGNGSGKGGAHRLVFEVAARLQARACAIVDGDLCSMTPDWIDALIRPVLQAHHDLVAPSYCQHKYNGGITSQLIYPLTRSLYGMAVRYPGGSEFGFSNQLVRRLTERSDWESTAARHCTGAWTTTIATAEDFSVCQSFLGPLRRESSDTGGGLTGLLKLTAGSVFSLMTEYEPVWRHRLGSRSIEQFGFPDEPNSEPIPVFADLAIEEFRKGCTDLAEIWRSAIDAPVWKELRALARVSDIRAFRFHDELWVHALSNLACTWQRRPMDRSHLLSALTPLYLGRFASWVIECEPMTGAECEARIERLCEAFESARPVLLAQWTNASAGTVANAMTRGPRSQEVSHGRDIPASV